ncbi:MAG: hypothetical protein NC120_06785 [Ruminococcus sp.]|nr:hypothetical protein [Ruminococcus sp.]
MNGWIKADDGELYPIAADEKVFENNLIGNYRADENLLPLIKFKDNSELTVQEVSFPLISEDERYRKVPNKIALALKDFFSDEIGFLCGLLSLVLGLFLPIIIAYKKQGYFDINDLSLLEEGVDAGLSLGVYISFLSLLNKFCGLNAYGLSKDTDIWTISFKDETVVRAKPFSVLSANKDFKETEFYCNVNDGEYRLGGCLRGDDIYFSEEAAANVLDFVLKSNDSELKKYYPNWKNDGNFVRFYKSNISRYGFDRACNSVFSSAVLADLEINGMTYKPATSINDLFSTYLSAVNRQRKAEKENQELIDKINDYQSGIS